MVAKVPAMKPLILLRVAPEVQHLEVFWLWLAELVRTDSQPRALFQDKVAVVSGVVVAVQQTLIHLSHAVVLVTVVVVHMTCCFGGLLAMAQTVVMALSLSGSIADE